MDILNAFAGHGDVVMVVGDPEKDLGFIDLENWRTSLAHYGDA